jgi:hypothetical protein
VVREVDHGHTVLFTHDVYEEWVLCQAFIGLGQLLVATLSTLGANPFFARPLNLLAVRQLETATNAQRWTALLTDIENAKLPSIWRRAVLLAPARSTRAGQLLPLAAGALLQPPHQRLRDLLIAIATLEVEPNLNLLTHQALSNLSADERASWSNQFALPKPLQWLRLLNWLMPQLDQLPRSLIPELVSIFEVWQRAFAGQGVLHCAAIAAAAHAWLSEFENALHPRRYQDMRRPFGVSFGGRKVEEALEDRIRSLFLASAGDAPQLAAAYLTHVKTDPNLIQKFLPGSHIQFVRHVPGELVDFLLAELCQDLNSSKRRNTLDLTELRELGLDHAGSYYPASPLQGPFLSLLREHPGEGLRLVRGLCNHAMRAWRIIHERGRKACSLLPVELDFPWGRQQFWGNGNVYVWFRGCNGPNPVESALMALEQWALERLEAGDEFDAVFRQIVEGNECVAVLGIGLSLTLAHPDKALQTALPLMGCSHLWLWDPYRFLEDSSGSPANLIGDWQRHRYLLQAVRDLNSRSHRKHEITDLIGFYLFNADAACRTRFIDNTRSLTTALPFMYADESDNTDIVCELEAKVRHAAERCDPANWHSEPAGDGKHYKVWCETPTQKAPETKQFLQANADYNKYAALALWADKVLKTGEMGPNFTVETALAQARALASGPDLFAQRLPAGDLDNTRPAAIAAVAAVAARHFSGSSWNSDVAHWCFEIVMSAATIVEAQDSISSRGAILLMHPTVYAAKGYAALLERGYKAFDCAEGLFNLAADAVEGVSVSVFGEWGRIWRASPATGWALMDLGLRLCIANRDQLPSHYQTFWDHAEAERNIELLDRAAHALAQPEPPPPLPTLPKPWVKDGVGPTRRRAPDGWRSNDELFLSNLAAKTFLKIEPGLILQHPAYRAPFLTLVGNLVAWTCDEAEPPWTRDDDHDRHHSNAYEWHAGIMAWLTRLAVHLTAQEVRVTILDPVQRLRERNALPLMRYFIVGFMIEGLLKPKDITDHALKLWGDIVDWVLTHPEWEHSRPDYLERDYAACLRAMFFCVQEDFGGQLVCGLEPGWPHLSKFFGLLERAATSIATHPALFHTLVTMLSKGGRDLLPNPALGWLLLIAGQRKTDRKFWEFADSGEMLAMLLDKCAFPQKGSMPMDLRIIEMANILVDNGVRAAGQLQQRLVAAQRLRAS